MPARSSLVALVVAMEAASGAVATVSDRGDHVRVSVPAPPDVARSRAVLSVLLKTATWGSSDGSGELRLWAAIPKAELGRTAEERRSNER
jgi:hypothetical protein